MATAAESGPPETAECETPAARSESRRTCVPIVSTGSLKITAIAVPASSATIEPGTRFVTSGHKQDDGERTPPTSTVLGSTRLPDAPPARHSRRKLARHGARLQSQKIRICVEAISTAIPFVNPIVTGRGINFTAIPSPVAPITSSRTPAITVTINSPDSPNFATIPATITTNAPVGPPICVREPPSAEIRNAAHHCRIDAGLRRHARRNPERHRQRQRHQAHRQPGDQVLEEDPPRVLAQAQGQFRQPEIQRSLSAGRSSSLSLLFFDLSQRRHRFRQLLVEIAPHDVQHFDQ